MSQSKHAPPRRAGGGEDPDPPSGFESAVAVWSGPTGGTGRRTNGRLHEIREEAFDLRQAVKKPRNTLTLKVSPPKDHFALMSGRLGNFTAALPAEQARVGTPK